MTMFERRGPRTRRLVSYLKRRDKTPAADRPGLDCRTYSSLFGKRAIVFTDTADFTTRTARHGILHFLMVFERLAVAAPAALRASGGEVVKVEGDSLLLRFQDVACACRGVVALEALLAQLNYKRPEDEQLRFSYGVGYGDVLDLDRDMFGLEVNLASKLGEDLAKPGEVLLTPAAAASLDARTLKRVVPYQIVTFGQNAIPVQRFKLPRK